MNWEKLKEYIIKNIAKMAVPEPMITDADLVEIRKVLQPGDGIVCRRNYEMSNALEAATMSSFWGHFAIYLGGDLPVYEATTKDGFRRVSLERLCLTKDAVGICRLPGAPWTDEQIKGMISMANSMLGMPYNFAMDWNSRHSVYCSQAGIRIWERGDAKDADAIKMTNELGTMAVTPQNMWDGTVQVARLGYRP